MFESEQARIDGSFAAGGGALVDFARALTEASSLQELERAFAPRFGRLLTAPMYGFYALDRDGSQIQYNVAVNVSDVFVGRYVRAMEVDPLLARSRETHRPVYNLGLMSEAEWKETDVYRDAYSVHRMHHVVEVPIVDGGRIVGALHCATHHTERNFTESDLLLAEAAAGVLALSIRRIHREFDQGRALEEALTALELTGTALIASRPRTAELRPNEAAQSLIAEIEDGEEHVHRLLARAPGEERFSRRAQVMLRSGESALLHANSQVLHDGDIITVLELQREAPRLNRRLLATLTPRESEVAALVADGLTDREIAECLRLSRYTVHQHIKRIYCAFDVDSRVALTRFLLGAPVRPRR